MTSTTAATLPASSRAHERARRVLVGGVNSPVRAFSAVGGTPVTVRSARGSRIEDVDGRSYIDLVGSWGPAIVGHANERVLEAVRDAASRALSFGAPCEDETNLAELILSALPGHERVRFVSTGTEACMTAARLARAATDRSLTVKFAGNYHGHADGMLVSTGSGAATLGVPNSPGVSPQVASSTLIAEYNDAEAVKRVFEEHGRDIAAVIVEPVAGNMGLVRPAEGFLEALRECCDAHGSLLIFDEVMTGFRVAWGGYQRLSDVRPDLTCLGKVIGGGMPVAAVAGRAELMDRLSPAGPVYQSGTLSGNPVAMAAGLATLQLCAETGFYERLGELTHRLAEGIGRVAAEHGIRVQTDAIGGMLGVAFSASPVRSFTDARACDHERYAAFFHAMLERGVWLPPSGYEAWFVSSAHTDADIDAVLGAVEESLRVLA